MDGFWASGLLEIASAGARLSLSVVFLAAAAGKLRDRTAFAHSVREYEVLPPWGAAAVAAALPWAEVLVGIGLIVAATATAAAAAAVVLLGSFAVAVAVNVWRGRSFGCACLGGDRDEPIGWRTLARQAALCALAALILGRAYLGASVAPSAAGEASSLAPSATGLVTHILVALAVVLASALVVGLRREARAFKAAGQLAAHRVNGS